MAIILQPVARAFQQAHKDLERLIQLLALLCGESSQQLAFVFHVAFHRLIDPRASRSVRATSRLRASSGSGKRVINPRFSSALSRCVMVPEVIISVEKSWVGERINGAPDRRRVASMSNSQRTRSWRIKADSMRGSSSRVQRFRRPMGPIGLQSRSGRSRFHCSRMRSTASA
jgi:hypothetical protein